ncbi:MAG: hypothetical protein GYB31_07665 [Bacteroidetes bacterium]|nr:hypothetical protein [Bacteroidota bacterium]
MKKWLLFIILIIAGNLIWMGFVRKPLPPIPEICAEISPEIKHTFHIESMNNDGLEFALNQKVNGKGMYIQFKMANAWKSGRAGLVVNGIKGNSGFSGGKSPQEYLSQSDRPKPGGKDFGHFMRDNKGKSVSNYTFKHTLTEGTDGKTYMRMSYDGPDMPMLQMLEVPRPITVPGHISKQFVSNGVVQFQKGTYAFDKSINGFYIPVKVN